MAIDPVCKMQVDESSAAATSDYKGETYYFCALGCKAFFDKEPEKYLMLMLTTASMAMSIMVIIRYI